MNRPSQRQVTQAIADATRAALLDLFSSTAEQFYYISLSSTEEAAVPILSAWSHEALKKEKSQESIKWSSSDSPYSMYGWDTHFDAVHEIFSRLPELDGSVSEQDWKEEYEFCFSCMEDALAILDREGLFGTGIEREQCVVIAEVVPPDSSNTDRALRLNPAAALVEWLREAAE